MTRSWLLWTMMAMGAFAGEARVDDVSFSRDIRPLLAEHCFQCHGPDAGTREADLRLDVRKDATAQRDDTPAIVPGDAGGSNLIARVTSDDESIRMPPLDSGKSLNGKQVEVLRRWIRDGRSLLLASHILHEVEAISPSFLLISGGRLLASGSAQEVHSLLADIR